MSNPTPEDRARQRALELADYDETIFIRWNDAFRHERFTCFEVISALDASAGLIAMAARRLGCTPNTIRNYVKRHAVVRLALGTIRNEICDLAWTQILTLIKERNPRVVIWYAARFGERRGYGRAQPAPEPVKRAEMMTIPWSELNLPPDTLRAVLEAVTSGTRRTA